MQYVLSLFTSFVSMFDSTVTLVEYVAPFPQEQQEWFVEYDINPEIWCLAEAVYFESKGEPVEGKIAVAQVVMNRVNSGKFPDTVCGVVYQPSNNPDRPAACQFSFTCSGKELSIKDLTKWDESVNIAAKVYHGVIKSDILAKHYVRCGLRRAWMKGMYQSRRVHNHCYFRKRS